MAATTAAVALSGGAATAAAAPGHPADRGSAVTKGPAEHTVAFEMTRVRVTELVTRAPDHAGNVTVRLADGGTLAIPAASKDLVMRRAAQQAKARPKDNAPGPCGTPWITLKEKTDKYPVALETGFRMDAPAFAYSWHVIIKGPNNYTDEYKAQGDLGSRKSWQGGYQSKKDQDEGLYTAEIDPTRSYVEFVNGDGKHEICRAAARRTQYLTKPKADCLKWAQANSGGGWIQNSSAPVPHRNRTDPTSPAGTRAGGARACLRWPLGEGSPASGDITGWKDAQDFVDKNPPGAAIARCHLIANTLGGKGQVRDGGQDNLVPCWQVGMNTGTPSMWTYERQVKQKVMAADMRPDDAVYYMVTPLYRDDASTIPTGVVMSAAVQRANGAQELMFTEGIPNTQARSGLNLGN
ncbi:DNA/RNA non-specific endonuclease [Streptomyces caatingaensis]|uniref:DNA/RNA non-specific endonuclease n=1 Tax=Streptomyces caatingaensis TaxID=1678637 RepID=UPI00069E8FC6|nr:DNA/RNA non-specific endonuclease [Streptomyces caatingaensis]